MKKIIFFSFFIVSAITLKSQEWVRYEDKKVHCLLTTFEYNNIVYPIVDSVTLQYYGKQKYAKSFSEFVPTDTVMKTKFSDFLFEKKKIPYVTYLYNGYHQSTLREGKPIEKKKSYTEFILFFIVLPLLIYLINEDVEIGNYYSYYVKKNFFFLAGSILFALCFNVILNEIIPHYLKLNYGEIFNFFGSYILYTFFSYVFILSLATLFVEKLKDFFFRDFPIVIFTGIIAAILAGISSEEIPAYSVLLIFGISLGAQIVISFFVEVIFFYFYDKYKDRKDRQERLKSESEKQAYTDVG